MASSVSIGKTGKYTFDGLHFFLCAFVSAPWLTYWFYVSYRSLLREEQRAGHPGLASVVVIPALYVPFLNLLPSFLLWRSINRIDGASPFPYRESTMRVALWGGSLVVFNLIVVAAIVVNPGFIAMLPLIWLFYLLAANARIEEVVSGTEVRFIGRSALWLVAAVPYWAAIALLSRVLTDTLA